MQPESGSLSLQTVERALRTVELLVQAPGPMTVREVAAQFGINRTTAHRLMHTLLVSGWLERAPDGGYQLSIKYLALGQVANQKRSFLTEIRPDLMQLSQRSRETVHVGVLDGYEVLHVDKVESLERVGVSSRIGTRGAIRSTSLGLALLANQPEAARARYVAWAKRAPGNHHLADVAAFTRRIEETIARGYSLDDEIDSIGVRCIGAAVRGTTGDALFAISLTGPSPRFTNAICAALGPELVEIAANLSARFGYRPPLAEGVA